MGQIINDCDTGFLILQNDKEESLFLKVIQSVVFCCSNLRRLCKSLGVILRTFYFTLGDIRAMQDFGLHNNILCHRPIACGDMTAVTTLSLKTGQGRGQ